MNQPLPNDLKIALAFAPHVRSLNKRVEALQKTYGQVPYFDPCDGGTRATVLVLLETPGPSNLVVRFVSRDNPSPTQKNLAAFLRDAGIPRDQSVLWNTVPWVIRKKGERPRSPRRAEIKVGLQELDLLLPLLGSLKVVVMSGRIAQQAAPYLRLKRPDLQLYCMPHPSPLSVCVSPSVGARISHVLGEISRNLTQRSLDRSGH